MHHPYLVLGLWQDSSATDSFGAQRQPTNRRPPSAIVMLQHKSSPGAASCFDSCVPIKPRIDAGLFVPGLPSRSLASKRHPGIQRPCARPSVGGKSAGPRSAAPGPESGAAGRQPRRQRGHPAHTCRQKSGGLGTRAAAWLQHLLWRHGATLPLSFVWADISGI